MSDDITSCPQALLLSFVLDLTGKHKRPYKCVHQLQDTNHEVDKVLVQTSAPLISFYRQKHIKIKGRDNYQQKCDHQNVIGVT
jgi:hypothetical protein